MKDIDRTFWSGLFAIGLTVVLVLICLSTVEAVTRDQPRSTQPRDWPPQIPNCDKELWERIKDGCDEQNSDD